MLFSVPQSKAQELTEGQYFLLVHFSAETFLVRVRVGVGEQVEIANLEQRLRSI